ncbi:MAG: AMP-dependent synthetase/ligase [Candidatus Omnitrophota bacterium]
MTEPQNLAQMFFFSAERYGKRKALLTLDPQDPRKRRALSWTQWAGQVVRTAQALWKIGISKTDRVGILSENMPEWTYADLAALALGAVVVPVYPTTAAFEIDYILRDSEIKVLFISGPEQWKKLLPLLDRNPQILKVITFHDVEGEHPKRVRFEDFMKIAAEEPDAGFDVRTQLVRVASADLATLIYTSGTTGEPKGVMLTHGNILKNIEGSRTPIHIRDTDTCLSFLPLSHIFERMAGYYFMLSSGATIAYARGMQTVAEDVRRVRPTVVIAVPRFFEKIREKIDRAVRAKPGFLRNLILALLKNACAVKANRRRGERVDWLALLAYGIGKALFFGKIRAELGGRIRFFVSGGAPLGKEIAEFFDAIGWVILEGYGLTETSPVISANAIENVRFGSVGRCIPGVEVKVAEDGEILTRGPCVMQGYWNHEAVTRESFDGDWFRTGDIGRLDADGYLWITDRKKDIIITAAGKNIAPQPLEACLLEDPLIRQVVILGDRRPYLVALVVPEREMILSLARDLGIRETGYAEILQAPKILEHVETSVRGRLSDCPSFQQVKFVALIEEEFTQGRGEMTPTMKLRRRVIADHYHAAVEVLYARGRQAQAASGAL